MKIFTKLYADLFDLTADDVVGLFGNVKPIETRSSKSCSIHPHKSCKIKLDRTYGELTVIGFAGQNNWVCICPHDKIQVVNGGNLNGSIENGGNHECRN